jgi:uncharacterized protein (TIGR02145 family)
MLSIFNTSKNIGFIFIQVFITSLMISTIISCEKDKRDPIITWENPADISYGTELSHEQLNAEADVKGTFVYTPPRGTILESGLNQVIRADFFPTDSDNYNSVSKTVTINVIEGIILNPSLNYSVITDQEGNEYHTITIGTQTWMAENLRTTKYRNGDPIHYEYGSTPWTTLTSGAYCWYNNNEGNKKPYGTLYNWYAVFDNRNICPAAWHVPSNSEWETLINYLGGPDVAGGKLKEVNTIHWDSPNTEATNGSGFTGLPGGLRFGGTGRFDLMGSHGNWWTSSRNSSQSVKMWAITAFSNGSANYNYNPNDGLSVRCVKD